MSKLRIGVEQLCLIVLLPMFILYQTIAKRGAVVASLSQWFAFIPGHLGRSCRVAMVRYGAKSIGRDIKIEIGTIFSNDNVELGHRVYIGAFCNVGWAIVGEDVSIGSNVHILSGRHTHFFGGATPISKQGGSKEVVKIGKGSWIGNGSIIMADIGENCVIGAGSVVVKPIPSGTLAVGVPAKHIKSIR